MNTITAGVLDVAYLDEGAPGHNLPQEAPEAFADTVLTVRGWL
jgi:hypothetical protein